MRTAKPQKIILAQIEQKQEELQQNVYEHVKLLFIRQRMNHDKVGIIGWMSDTDLILQIFGTKNPSKKQVHYIKKARMRVQKEIPGMVGKHNESGEYVRGYPKTEIEQDEYANIRQSVIVGQICGLVKNIKSNSQQLGYDWKYKAKQILGQVSAEGTKYLEDKTQEKVKL